MTKSTVTTKGSVLELYRMLSFMRPHLSKTEDAFIAEFLDPLGIKEDAYGNLYKRIGTAPVMWSSHTDTVHTKGGKQNIALRDKRIIELDNNSVSNCLGADDTAGVWLMTEMIKSEVSGLYVFHRGEEVGCKGSEWLFKNNKEALKDIKACIALDRRDNDSVITFQRGQRCCSDDFGKSIAEELNSVMWGEQHFNYKLDDGGAYTDSATYVDIIGECTNLSVGYKCQHGKSENLDLLHIANLREALIRMDLSKLRYSRVAGTKESKYQSWKGGYHGTHNRWQGWQEDWDYSDYMGSGSREMYVKDFHHGYWDLKKNCWVQMNHDEWSAWRTKILVKNKPNGGVTSKATDFSKSLSVQDNKPMLPRLVKPAPDPMADFDTMMAEVINKPAAVTLLLIDWGLDEPMLKDLLKEFVLKLEDEKKPATIAPKEEGAPTIQ